MASRIELPLRLVVLPGGRVHLSLRLPPASSGRAFLEWEVQQLVAHKPPGLMHAELLPDGPRMVLDADGEAVEGPLCGPPYQVLLRIQRPRSGVYWSEGGLVVRLLCGEGYPASPPEVRFEALLHHFFLDDLGGLPDLFYEVMQDLAEADAEERAASLSHLVGSLPGGEGGEGGVEAAGAAGGEGLAVEHSHAAGSSGGVAGGTRYSLRGTLHMLHYLLQAPLHPCDGCQQRFDYFASLHRDRAAAIAQYQPLRRHPSLFGTAARWRREWLSADARAALESRGGGGGLRSHLVEVSPEVFAFPLLREECCAMLVEEVDSYLASGLKAARPNSMNQYGLVLNEVGMEALFDSLLETVLQPIARACFPREGGGLDRHHSFVVQYAAGKDLGLGMHADDSEEAIRKLLGAFPDLGLDMHTDDSDVTFNICLGRDFEGAGLSVCGDMGDSAHRHFTYRHTHRVGHCLMHLGRRRHGADDITAGERINLIIWCKGAAYRASRHYLDLQQQRSYAAEAAPPDDICLSYTHDRDFMRYRTAGARHAAMRRTPWVPPRSAEYPGYEEGPCESDGGSDGVGDVGCDAEDVAVGEREEGAL